MDTHRDIRNIAHKKHGFRIHYFSFPVSGSNRMDLFDHGGCAEVPVDEGGIFRNFFAHVNADTMCWIQRTGISLNKNDPVKHCMFLKNRYIPFLDYSGKEGGRKSLIEAGL